MHLLADLACVCVASPSDACRLKRLAFEHVQRLQTPSNVRLVLFGPTLPFLFFLSKRSIKIALLVFAEDSSKVS